MVVRYDRRTLCKNALTKGAGVFPAHAGFFELLHFPSPISVIYPLEGSGIVFSTDPRAYF